MTQASLLPEFDPTQRYLNYNLSALDSEGRYKSDCIEMAVRRDNAGELMECVERGFINKDSKALCGQTVVGYCEFRNAAKCADALRKAGWPE